jgi:hypothetical protein
MEQPLSCEDPEIPSDLYVCQLSKSLYGLKQVPRLFTRALGESLRKFGLNQCKTDPSIFMSEEMIFGCYLDDLLVISSEYQRNQLMKFLKNDKFDPQELGEMKQFLGLKVQQDATGIQVTQGAYIDQMVKEFGIVKVNLQ